jgi:hypothetical protein
MNPHRINSYVRFCHHCTAHHPVTDGGDGLQICRVNANILKKQPQTADKGWSSSLSGAREVNNF